MRFTEHELTVALTGAAKSVVAARKRFRKGGVDIDSAWDAMDRFERFKLLDALGSQILPVLVALPDDVGKLRRAVVVKTRTALVQTALAHLPPRLDPDALGTAQDS
jgi:hypothetical protein